MYRPYLYPCMVPIKREPLTAFVSDTVAVLARVGGAGQKGGGSRRVGAASGCYRPSGFISVQRRCGVDRRGGRGRETRGDGQTMPGYRVFHKDSMKIAWDFITGEMSVNKNEYGEGERKRRTDSTFTPDTPVSSSWFLCASVPYGQRFVAARSRARRVNLVV